MSWRLFDFVAITTGCIGIGVLHGWEIGVAMYMVAAGLYKP